MLLGFLNITEPEKYSAWKAQKNLSTGRYPNWQTQWSRSIIDFNAKQRSNICRLWHKYVSLDDYKTSKRIWVVWTHYPNKSIGVRQEYDGIWMFRTTNPIWMFLEVMVNYMYAVLPTNNCIQNTQKHNKTWWLFYHGLFFWIRRRSTSEDKRHYDGEMYRDIRRNNLSGEYMIENTWSGNPAKRKSKKRA